MKKINRIFLCFFALVILGLGNYVLVDEFWGNANVFGILKEDTSLLIPVYFSLMSVFGLLFNIKKFNDHLSLQDRTYKILRVGDLIFSVSLLIMFSVGFYFLVKSINTNKINFSIYPFMVISLFLFFAAVNLFDNILYHKKQLLLLQKDDINEIEGL
jgi:hypothetical protein